MKDKNKENILNNSNKIAYCSNCKKDTEYNTVEEYMCRCFEKIKDTRFFKLINFKGIRPICKNCGEDLPIEEIEKYNSDKSLKVFMKNINIKKEELIKYKCGRICYKKKLLSHGFKVGKNDITITKIDYWRHNRELPNGIDGLALSSKNAGFEISNCSNNFLTIRFNTDEDIDKFYNLVISL